MTIAEKKKLFFTFVQSKDEEIRMNCSKVYIGLSAQMQHTSVIGGLYTFRSINCPILRFRRPILPRA